MTDLEDFIRSYQPLGPPSDLKDRVLNLRTQDRRAWLLVAASALLALASVLLSAREHSLLTTQLAGAGLSSREQQVRAMAASLGNDAAAVVQAELIIARDEPETTVP